MDYKRGTWSNANNPTKKREFKINQEEEKQIAKTLYRKNEKVKPNYKKKKKLEIEKIKRKKRREYIQNAIELLEGRSGTIAVLKDNATYRCKMNAIYYIESVDKRTFVYTKEGCFESKNRLYELEDILNGYFARCSKAMIVNLRKLRKVEPEFSGRMMAELLNGEKIVISRGYVKDIKRRLDI